MDQLDQLMKPPAPTRTRPLLGATFLLVEDSRLAAEGFRLLCLRSGARIRRADSLTTARRHLRVYRPTITLVDMTLPDGTGDELIAELAGTPHRSQAVVAVSGDATMKAPALAAGADAFLLKPISRVADFQAAMLALMPKDRRPSGPRALVDTMVEPDAVAYQDDLHHAAETLCAAATEADIAYLSQFLGSVADTAGDTALAQAARSAASGEGVALSALSEMIRKRIAAADPV